MGIVQDLTVQFGFPLAPLLLPLVSPTVATVCITVSGALGFLFMYLIAGSVIPGRGAAVFVLLLVAVTLVGLALGLWFGLTAETALSPAFYGIERALLVSGLAAVSLSSGGAGAGALFYFSPLSLADNLLVLSILQGTLAPVVIGLVHSSVAARRPRVAAAETHTLLPEQPSLQQQVPAESLWSFLRNTLREPRFWHVAAITVLMIGIGSTFVTNFGSALMSTLSPLDSKAYVQRRVSLGIIGLNFSQLLGRFSVMLLASRTTSPYATPVRVIMMVALGYAACFCATLWATPFTYTTMIIIGCVFGFVYGYWTKRGSN